MQIYVMYLYVNIFLYFQVQNHLREKHINNVYGISQNPNTSQLNDLKENFIDINENINNYLYIKIIIYKT